MNIVVDVGVGDSMPKDITVGKNETVGTFRRRYAEELGVSPNNVQLVNDLSTTLSNDRAKLSSVVQDGETIHVTPRAKAGSI